MTFKLIVALSFLSSSAYASSANSPTAAPLAMYIQNNQVAVKNIELVQLTSQNVKTDPKNTVVNRRRFRRIRRKEINHICHPNRNGLRRR